MSDFRAPWYVLLVGGPSGVGKTTVAAQLARRLDVAWLMVDDLRLALQRSGLAIPDNPRAEALDPAEGAEAVGEVVSPGIEVVIENHVDQYGEWLARESSKRGLPTVPVRPRDTLVERILGAVGLTSGSGSDAVGPRSHTIGSL